MGVEGWLRAAGEASQEVLSELRGGLGLDQDHPGIVESFAEFVKAVDWTERWIQGILAAQVALFLIVLLSRNRPGVQAALFFAAATPVYLGSRINGLLASNWRSFARQPYFDESGIFYSAVVAAPLLCDLFAIVVVHVAHSCADLARMKRIQLARRAKELAKERTEAEGRGEGGERPVAAGQERPSAGEGGVAASAERPADEQGLRRRARRA